MQFTPSPGEDVQRYLRDKLPEDFLSDGKGEGEEDDCHEGRYRVLQMHKLDLEAASGHEGAYEHKSSPIDDLHHPLGDFVLDFDFNLEYH